MPVVRHQFKAANGKVQEGNVLVDSGAGTTVIRKDFAKALGLQGRNERIDLAVVGGERVQQNSGSPPWTKKNSPLKPMKSTRPC